MRRPSVVFFASFLLCCAARAADATSPIDYTDRNVPFTPGGNVQPNKRTPEINQATQQKRVTPPTVEKQQSAIGERRAAIDMTESRDKVVHEKEVRTPEKLEQPKTGFDQQRARITTAGNTNKPPTVSKYQDSLVAASASNMARYPAVSAKTSTKVNRFVFRKNGGELSDAPSRASVTPAAGGSVLVK